MDDVVVDDAYYFALFGQKTRKLNEQICGSNNYDLVAAGSVIIV